MKHPRVRGAQSPPLVKAARAAVRAAGFATVADRGAIEVVLASVAPDAERLAASEWVRGHELEADGWDSEHGPFWLGWCPHAAFLAGIAWHKARGGSENKGGR